MALPPGMGASGRGPPGRSAGPGCRAAGLPGGGYVMTHPALWPPAGKARASAWAIIWARAAYPAGV
jgi:hypothetical protein